MKLLLPIAILGFGLMMGCASGHCRQMASSSSNTAPASADATAATGAKVTDATASPSSQKVPVTASSGANVEVFKYDGAQQCGMGAAVSAEEMEKELKGIPVVAREKKSDGMMRVQVCGASTGMANVYTIPATRLSDAQKRGFKKWTY